jgi:hypothetical protein
LSGLEPRPPVTPAKEKRKRGHSLVDGNLYFPAECGRECLTCRRLRDGEAIRRRSRRRRLASKYRAGLYNRRKVAGACTRCGRDRDSEDHAACSSCKVDMRARWRAAYSKLEAR